jgi:hypothetical protein
VTCVLTQRCTASVALQFIPLLLSEYYHSSIICVLQPAANGLLEALVDCANSHPFPPSPSMLSLPEDMEAIG